MTWSGFSVKGSFCPLLCSTDQLSRLHMILKPFMLRRIKKDVENELSDKVLSMSPTDKTWTDKHPLVLAQAISFICDGDFLAVLLTRSRS